jgi:predicted transcriptional regulator
MLMELGRRERQIMDAVYRLGRATVAEVRAELADAPSYSAVRGMLRFLEEKGQLRHVQDGVRYVYLPTVAPSKARKSALQRLVHTFFGGSAQQAVAALLEDSKLEKDDLDRLQDLIDEARKEGR